LFGFGSADFFRLEYRDSCGESSFFDGGKGNFVAASAGTVRLRDDGGDFEVGLGEKVLQGRDGELGSAAKEKAHGLFQTRT
jgi:hypothetical protein